MKKIALLAAFALMSVFVPAFSEASLKSRVIPTAPITIEQAIEVATGEEPGVAMNARWQSGYLEITIKGDEVRVEKLYLDPRDGRIVGVNLKDNEDILASAYGDVDVRLDYIEGHYRIEVLKLDGTIRKVYVNETDGSIF